MIPWLEDNDYRFPDVSTALTEPDGLLAASERLTPELVINAYEHGIFPWYSAGQPVLWWSPNPRCVLHPQKFHVSRSFKRTLNNSPFQIKTDTAFREVMLACAEPRADKQGTGNSGTWITGTMLAVYCQLYEAGHAHSIECWHDDKLVGGMYGLIMGDIFFGESMFSRMENASKVAMHYLCTRIQPHLIDAQVYSEHLHTLGAEVIDRSDFARLIKERLSRELKF
jgi:leucyl/phenylalanyl-tRNA---protein transferase